MVSPRIFSACHPPPLAPGALHVWVTALDVPASSLAAMRETMSPDEQMRADAFAFDRHRRRFIVARARLRALLAWYLACHPRTLRFRYGARGKPALETSPDATSLAFNVAHSDELVVYAVARGCNVGVDVERIRDLEESAAIARYVFTREERAALHSAPIDEHRMAWFQCWVRKEAYLKGVGLGFACVPSDVTVAPGPAGAPGRVHVRGTDHDGPWRVYDLLVDAGCAAAVAADVARDVSCWRCDEAFEPFYWAPDRVSQTRTIGAAPVEMFCAP